MGQGVVSSNVKFIIIKRISSSGIDGVCLCNRNFFRICMYARGCKCLSRPILLVKLRWGFSFDLTTDADRLPKILGLHFEEN